MSKDYLWCLRAWVSKWTTAEKLKIWADAGKITQGEYTAIISTSQEG